MENNWKDKVLDASQRMDEDQVKMFLSLVDQASERCTLEVARILMKTFTDKPDFGTQERVINVLSTADHEIVIRSMLEELPRLMEESPEWAESLIGLEIDKRGKLVEKISAEMPENIKAALRKICSNKSFYDFYPSAKQISI
jgi:hypothetical protein